MLAGSKMKPKLMGELILRRPQRTAYVLCGGPSLKEFDPMNVYNIGSVVLSANAHGAKYVHDYTHERVDYIVSVDHKHTETGELMEPQLRQHFVPIISPQFWANYRLHDWGFAGNSGMQAVYVAWLMGCSPIVIYGMDCYTGPTYWNNATASNISAGRGDPFFRNKLRSLHNIVGSDHVRLASGSGLALEFFPRYKPGERMPIFMPTPHHMKRIDPKTVDLELVRDWTFNKAPLKAGERYTFTENEATRLINKRIAVLAT